MLLDELVPRYHFNEVHQVTIDADPSTIYRAIQNLTPGEVPLMRLLFAMRSLPSWVTGKGRLQFTGHRPLLQSMTRSGFSLLAETPDRELVLGVAGQFWNPRGGPSVQFSDAESFRTFDDPAYARVAMNFHISGGTDGNRTVRTETRIHVPGRGARRQFALYWRLIYPGSAFIRRMWLHAVKRRAEADSAQARM